ncbi:MAG: SBBP repeat-containing protein, partial [Thermoplasmata archaeon]
MHLKGAFVPKIMIFHILIISLLIVLIPNANAQNKEEWIAIYNGPENSVDRGIDVAVGPSGNIYVTGWSWDASTEYDFATACYDPNGHMLWSARYNGPENDHDFPRSMVLDSNENVIVTGWSFGNGTDRDYITIKYNKEGKELWTTRYNGPGNKWDEANDVVCDLNGNIFVTGHSCGKNGVEFTTIAYDVYGNELWIARMEDKDYTSSEGKALDIGPSGNIYVTGYGPGIDPYWPSIDYLTVAYNADGKELWIARYNGPEGFIDEAYDIVVDQSENVYVTGQSQGDGWGYDFATVAYDSKGTELWVARYTDMGNSCQEAKAIALDSQGNIYVTGHSLVINSSSMSTRHDYATVKYNQNGDLLWVAIFNGPRNGGDHPYDLVIDDLGNVYVTGRIYSNETSWDSATVAYDIDGNELWRSVYNSPDNSSEVSYAIDIDSKGNVYVIGDCNGDLETSTNFLLIKYPP